MCSSWYACRPTSVRILSVRPSTVRLQSRAHLPVRVLSQGQRQGVALARLRTSPAKLWVLDEPLVGLDVQATDTARSLLQSHLDAGGAIVMTSHHDVGLRGPGSRFQLGAGACTA